MATDRRLVLDAIDERSFDQQSSANHQSRHRQPNPLIRHFLHDPVVMELEIDTNERFRTSRGQLCMQCLTVTLTPCAWPLVVYCALGVPFCCLPCDYACYAKDRMKSISDAHRLTLRENSIHYVVDTHTQAPICQPLCFNYCCGMGQAIEGFEEVFPLSMVSWSGDVPAEKRCNIRASDTFLLRVNSTISAAIDAASNGAEFSSAIDKHKALIADRTGGVPGADLPAGVFADFQTYHLAAFREEYPTTISDSRSRQSSRMSSILGMGLQQPNSTQQRVALAKSMEETPAQALVMQRPKKTTDDSSIVVEPPHEDQQKQAKRAKG